MERGGRQDDLVSIVCRLLVYEGHGKGPVGGLKGLVAVGPRKVKHLGAAVLLCLSRISLFCAASVRVRKQELSDSVGIRVLGVARGEAVGDACRLLVIWGSTRSPEQKPRQNVLVFSRQSIGGEPQQSNYTTQPQTPCVHWQHSMGNAPRWPTTAGGCFLNTVFSCGQRRWPSALCLNCLSHWHLKHSVRPLCLLETRATPIGSACCLLCSLTRFCMHAHTQVAQRQQHDASQANNNSSSSKDRGTSHAVSTSHRLLQQAGGQDRLSLE